MNEARYQHTDEQAIQAGEAAVEYVLTGDHEKMPEEFKGLVLFGIARALRINDELLYGSDRLDVEQVERLGEIEFYLENALNRNLHYAPFGHNDSARYRPANDRELRQLGGSATSTNRDDRRTLAKARA